MCGVTGLVNWSNCKVLEEANQAQTHRGPDDSGIWESILENGRRVGLGSRRLSILDLSSAGHMPMTTPNGRFTIVYNGEIYNYPQLRQQLEAKGFTFRSNSDTEAILYLYQVYGPECVKQLNGMFAIAIWDSEKEQMFLARDHFGIKPLYYHHSGDKLAFASEIKALLTVADIPRQLNYYALQQYLSFLWVPDPLTILDGVFKLPAGHYALFQGGKLNITCYWDLEFPRAEQLVVGNEAELALELRQRFHNVVKSQMLSDVPVGAFLSAGLDSSSIVAMMVQQSSQPLRTFTIAFPKKYRRGEIHLDDTAVAQRTADFFGCHHTEIVMEPDVASLLPKLIWHMDEPTADPAIIAAYLVNREARKDVTVLLSGIGGDELFGGYRKYQAHYLAQAYQRIPFVLRHHLLEPAIAKLPAMRGSSLKGHIRLAKKMARSGSLPPQERFIMDSIYLDAAQRVELYTANLATNINGHDPRQRHLDYFSWVTHADFLNQMLYVDTKAFMTSLNLTYNDKMSMASSVEVRVPFLDWEFAEWVAGNIPPNLKLKQGTTKHILREAMRPLLPAEVLEQKKAGFGAPVDYWLADDLREMVDDLLSVSQINKRGLFKPETVRRYVDEQRAGQEDWSLQIWQFLTLELWMQTFLD